MEIELALSVKNLVFGDFRVFVGSKTVFASDGVFEKYGFYWKQGEGHVGTKEAKGANGGKICGNVWERVEIDDAVKGELGENDGGGKSENIHRENWFLRKSSIRVKNEGDKNGENDETG